MIARARHSAIHPRAQLSAGRDAGHGGAVPHPPARRGIRLHPTDLHRPGVEHGFQLLRLAEIHSARAARSRRASTASARWQRFVELELPYGAIGLVWNSMVSVAGGWFFLMACEMFVLGKRDFRLPGLGSYLQTAASAGDTAAILWGLGTMIGVILLIDQLIWRPAIAWSDKFKFEQVESASQASSALLHLLRRSTLLARFRNRRGGAAIRTYQRAPGARRGPPACGAARHGLEDSGGHGGRSAAGGRHSLWPVGSSHYAQNADRRRPRRHASKARPPRFCACSSRW